MVSLQPIDLDMDDTEYTIGFDTAVNTGMDALNKLRDTSSSHEHYYCRSDRQKCRAILQHGVHWLVEQKM